MKKITNIIISCVAAASFSGAVFANAPLVPTESQGGVVFDADSALARDVSVEKQVLLFRVHTGDAAPKQPKYVGETYLRDILNKQGLTNAYLDQQTWGKNTTQLSIDDTVLYKTPDHTHELTAPGMADVTIQYTLKNERNQKIENAEASFSLKDQGIGSAGWYEPKEKCNDGNDDCYNFKDVYILHSENFDPKGLRVFFGDTALDVQEKISIEKSTPAVTTKSGKRAGAVNRVKKVSSFSLSFLPNETKKLTIHYSVPLWTLSGWGGSSSDARVTYDFLPVFLWKGARVGEVLIVVQGDDTHILNSQYSRLVGEGLGIDFVSPRENLYYKKYRTITRDQVSAGGLEIVFSTRDAYITSNGGDNRLGSDSLGLYTKNGILKVKGMRPSGNPQNIIVDFTDGVSREYHLFDLLRMNATIANQEGTLLDMQITPALIKNAYGQHNIPDVIELAKKYLEAHPDDIEVLTLLHKSLFMVGDFESAAKIEQKIGLKKLCEGKSLYQWLGSVEAFYDDQIERKKEYDAKCMPLR